MASLEERESNAVLKQVWRWEELIEEKESAVLSLLHPFMTLVLQWQHSCLPCAYADIFIIKSETEVLDEQETEIASRLLYCPLHAPSRAMLSNSQLHPPSSQLLPSASINAPTDMH
jgi:hypothetical protein